MFPQEGIKGNDGMATKMRRSISEKAMAHKQRTKKKTNDVDGDDKSSSSRFLISINVWGSAGAIRFVVKGDDSATAVIEAALKIYAREGRLPILGSHAHTFSLYPAHHDGFQALDPSEKIGSRGERNFVLSKREEKPHMTEARSEMINGKRKGWRAWLQKSLSLKILSH